MEALREAKELYPRRAITQPLSGSFTVEEFIQAVMPHAELTQGVCFQGELEIAEGSFGLRSPRGIVVYGTEVAGFVFILGFRNFPLPADIQRNLSAFMSLHGLVLTHWIRGRILLPADLAQ
jgi:hypothetical protein